MIWIIMIHINREYIPVGDESPVLHGTSGEVRQGDHVDLGQRELDLEEVLEVLEDLGSDLETVRGLLDSFFASPDADVALIRVQRIEIRDYESDEVRRHRYRSLEVVPDVRGQTGTVTIFYTTALCIIRYCLSSRIVYIYITHTGLDSRSFGMFEMAVMLLGRAMLIWNLALSAGSSKQGKARRASVGWNCVVAIHLKTITTTITTI